MELNEHMSFGHVVRSDGASNVTDVTGMLANEVIYLNLDADGQSLDDHFEDLYPGWTALTGFTGQYGYHGAVLHPSEYIGGRLETYIRENAGFYVAVVVDGQYDDDVNHDDEDLSIGWAILYRPFDDELADNDDEIDAKIAAHERALMTESYDRMFGE